MLINHGQQSSRLKRAGAVGSGERAPLRTILVPMSMPAATPMPTMDADVVTESNRPWQCIVWDDQVNSMSYVTYVFQMLFGMDRKKAHALMMTVHTEGKAIVSSGERDKVEADVKKLHKAGLWATMEQAD